MAFDAFLKIEGIEGESTDAKHKGEIEILSWSWGASNPSSSSQGGGGGAGKVNVQDFSFVHLYDKASPKLMESCCNGKHFQKVELTVRKSGGQPVEYMKVTFTDILVSSFQVGGNASSDPLPMEQVSLNFAKIEVRYLETNRDGKPGGQTTGSCCSDGSCGGRDAAGL